MRDARLLPPGLTEADVTQVWARGWFRKEELITEDARKLTIEFPGIPSAFGPDFRHARLYLDGRLRVGDVEIHIFEDEWAAHRHGENPEYAGVVLHVALFRSADAVPRTPFGSAIPSLVLEPYLARPLSELLAELRSGSSTSLFEARRHTLPPSPGFSTSSLSGDDQRRLIRIAEILDAAGDARLKRKVARFANLAREASSDQVLYRETMSAMGYRANRAMFESLATIVPLSALAGRDAAWIQQALAFAGGLVEASPEGFRTTRRLSGALWRTRSSRPSNHPLRRIEAMAQLLAAGSLSEFLLQLLPEEPIRSREEATATTRNAVRRLRAAAPSLGGERAEAILFNVVVPHFLALYAANSAFEEARRLREWFSWQPSPPDNSVTRIMKKLSFGESRWEEAGRVVATLRRHMGLLEWYHDMFGNG